MKRQSTEWKEKFANHIADKGLIQGYTKNYNSIIKTQIAQLKMGRRFEHILPPRKHIRATK